MKILTIVKSTGYNFIRHYLPYFPPGSKTVHREKEAFEQIPNFPIVLFEWANDLSAKIITSEKFRQLQIKHGFTTVVRIHDHEVTKVYGNMRRIDHIPWGRVDKIWFINPLIQKQFHEYKPGHEGKSFFVPNAVDPELFPENRADTKKVGLVSLYFRHRKRIDRVVEVAKLLPDWEFCIRTELPYNMAGHEFYNEFQKFRQAAKGLNNITIDHRLVGTTVKTHYENTDLVSWYHDKAVVLSTSDWEGFSYCIGEGAMSGCMPVVWNWLGSEYFWKPYLVESAEQAAQRISEYKPSYEYRRYVLDYFNPEVLIKKVLEQIKN